MKTLKFMLAAATAIGLASATQAAQNTQASTGFEKLAQDTAVVTGLSDNDGNSYFYYTGATAADNESVIAAAPDLTGAQRPTGVTKFTGADLSSRDKVLKVSTGTEPLLRTFAPLSGSAPQAAAAITDDTYVDTLVQFTVTPYTDNVTPGSSDKLMIYLKEMTNSVGEVTGTNLVVVGGYSADGMSVAPHEYVVRNSGLEVKSGTWYRLTVKCIANLGKLDGFAYPAFCVYIDGTLCDFGEFAIAEDAEPEEGATGFVAPFNNNESYGTVDKADLDLLYGYNVVFSLLCDGAAPATLQAVGFAGEGFVDDLVVTTTDPFNVNIVDFTFNRSGEGVGAVSFTVNGGSAQSSSDTYEVTIGDTITVTAEAQSGYELIAPTFSGLTADPGNTYALATYTVTGAASLTINAQEAAQADWAADSSTVANQTAAAAYPALANSALATADAQKLTDWAKAKSIAFADVAADTTGTYTEAFLLNCAVADVAEEKEEFVLDISVAADGTITVSLPAGKSYNGTLQMKGSADLTTWTDVSEASSTYKFYKYELSL